MVLGFWQQMRETHLKHCMVAVVLMLGSGYPEDMSFLFFLITKLKRLQHEAYYKIQSNLKTSMSQGPANIIRGIATSRYLIVVFRLTYWNIMCHRKHKYAVTLHHIKLWYTQSLFSSSLKWESRKLTSNFSSIWKASLKSGVGTVNWHWTTANINWLIIEICNFIYMDISKNNSGLKIDIEITGIRLMRI